MAGNKQGTRTKKALKEELFPYEYVVDFNGQKAAERCGYLPAGARVEASRLLTKPNIRAKIKELLEARKAETIMTAQEWDERLTVLCRSNLKDYYDENGQLKAVKDLNAEQAYALKSITSFTSERDGGKSTVLGQTVERYNPREALKLMGQRLGLLKNKVEVGESFEALMREIHGLQTKDPKGAAG